MTIQIDDVVGDYRVIGIAGSGGMGAVYKIEHRITKRIEAMKLLPPALTEEPEQVQRFEREIQVHSRLHHPNIVELYNAIRVENSSALVMEFVEGDSLQHVLESGALPFKTAVSYTSQILSALAYAHEAGVIHRDVGPANIIITADGTVKLTDFGLARAETDLRVTSSGVPVGSPWYMSPEQVRGVGVIDARTDIYAVGAVLHEMLTGCKLFDAGGAFAVMRAQVEAVPAPPSFRNPNVPPILDEIVRKALAKDPAFRFQSAAEFRQSLEDAFHVRVPAATTQAAAQPQPKQQKAVPPPAAGRLSPGGWPRMILSHPVLLVAAVPALMFAALCSVRMFPKAKHASAAVARPVQSQPVPAADHESQPAATPLIVEPKVASDPILLPAEPVQPRKARRAVRPDTAQSSAAPKSEPAYALRVTGAEVAPAPSPAAPRAASPIATAEHRTAAPDPMEPPLVPAPVVVAPAPADLPALPEPEQAKPEKPSNRFVRALGKINPFKKGAKEEPTDSSKPLVKKD